MESEAEYKIIVGLEVRQSAFGYAVFEEPTRLLDWGATSRSPNAGAVARSLKRFLAILRLHSPDIVVVKTPRYQKALGVLFESIKHECITLSIPFVFIANEELKDVFPVFRVRSNADRAEVLTRIFPELRSRLPRRRRVWQSESHAMIVFGAVTAGYAFWQQQETTTQM